MTSWIHLGKLTKSTIDAIRSDPGAQNQENTTNADPAAIGGLLVEASTDDHHYEEDHYAIWNFPRVY